jgi:hypothetical protein
MICFSFRRKVYFFAILVLAIPFAGAVATESAGWYLSIEAQFDDVGQFHEGIAPARSGDLWGFINREGKWVVKPTFGRVKSGSGGRFAVEQNGYWGFINTLGELVIPVAFQDVRPFQDGVAAVKQRGTWRFIGPSGKNDNSQIFDFTELTSRSEGFALAQRSDGWFIIPPEGMIIGLGPYLDARSFSEGRAAVKSQTGWHIIDTRGRSVGSEFADIRPFCDGMAAATPDGEQWGFVDRDGNYAIRMKFEAAREFSNGLAPAKFDGEWGFINESGAWVLEPTYDAAYTFRENYALVRQGKKRGFLQFNGNRRPKEWVEPTYDDAFGFSEGLAPVKSGLVWGFIESHTEYDAGIRDVTDIEP